MNAEQRSAAIAAAREQPPRNHGGSKAREDKEITSSKSNIERSKVKYKSDSTSN